jgi:hypothetical protein
VYADAPKSKLDEWHLAVSSVISSEVGEKINNGICFKEEKINRN